jgi:soluble lytic murein transglycosylase
MKKQLTLAIIILFFAAANFANAAPQILDFRYSVISDSDKEIAKKAVAESSRSNWTSARRVASKAKDPIIYKLVQWIEFKESRNPSIKEISVFLRDNPDWALEEALKRRIGIALPSDGGSSANWRRVAEKARDLLEANRASEAIKLVEGKYKHLSGGDRADALWLSGWINLRFLKRPDHAIKDFHNLLNNVGYPVSLSRAQYWLGRAYEAKGDKKSATEWYKQGAKHYTYFYGQLAALKINPNYEIILPQYTPPNILDAKDFVKDDRIKAARILDEIGHPEYGRLFLIRYLDGKNRTPQDYALTAILAQQTVNYEWAVMAGKKASLIQLIIPQANYPILMYTPPAPEKALVMSIIRQESQLNRFAKSPVGAIGMMQIMPETARGITKELGEPYNPGKLYDKDYNMRLGSFYINKRINDLKGSYIVASAAYNAGVGNALKWVARFGDPRTTRDTDKVIDWLESIPFSETRNYVQRVLETTQVYRARLNGGKARLLLIQDLHRYKPQ